MTWFHDIFGFEESGYRQTQAQFSLEGDQLHTRTRPPRTFHAGTLSLPSLSELRHTVSGLAVSPGKGIQVHPLVADAYELHRHPAVNGAVVQVASQFNLLEMPDPSTLPEKGITGYQYDHTQGPACAMACAAATVVRNYLVRVGGQTGQTRTAQLNTLSDLTAALGIDGRCMMQNGYALLSRDTVQAISRQITALDEPARDTLRQQLRVGLHADTQVTIQGTPAAQRVTQVLCSALPVAYHPFPRSDWAPLATLILEAGYEATLLAAVLNHYRTGNPRVYLTLVGGGAFGNDLWWIVSALRRALSGIRQHALEIHLVVNRSLPAEFSALLGEFPGG